MAKVCIDVGHYKGYNVSPALSEYSEGTRMWKLGEYLIAALKRRGITVVQTRTDIAKDPALYTRGKTSKGCDLFLSLHSNAVGSRVDEKVDYPLAIVMLDGSSTDIGLALAKVVQSKMGTTQAASTTTKKNSAGSEWFGVLRGAAYVGTPGVILEHSFHTNTKATEWLLSDANLKSLAEAEADCIKEWLDAKSEPETDDFKCPFKVRVTIKNLNIRSGPGTNFSKKGYINPGVYTITKEENGFGKLKSGAGWISLDYAKKV